MHGELARNGDLLDAEVRASYSDSIAAALLSGNRDAQRVVSAMIGFENPARLPEDDPLVLRADACETALWAAFITRAKTCAGEA